MSESEKEEEKEEESSKDTGICSYSCVRCGQVAVSPCVQRVTAGFLIGWAFMLLTAAVATFCMIVLIVYNFDTGYEAYLLSILNVIFLVFSKPPKLYPTRLLKGK
ncbi:MAG: hypothetical protein QW303_02815 [Nitrososphaerota archaeon]